MQRREPFRYIISSEISRINLREFIHNFAQKFYVTKTHEYTSFLLINFGKALVEYDNIINVIPMKQHRYNVLPNLIYFSAPDFSVSDVTTGGVQYKKVPQACNLIKNRDSSTCVFL